jgi:hypothetical protein
MPRLMPVTHFAQLCASRHPLPLGWTCTYWERGRPARPRLSCRVAAISPAGVAAPHCYGR